MEQVCIMRVLSKRMLCSIVGLFVYCKSLFCVCSAIASDINYLSEATIVAESFNDSYRKPCKEILTRRASS